MKPKNITLFFGELETEFRGEPFGIPFNLFIQSSCFHSVKISQVAINHYLKAPDCINTILDFFSTDQLLSCHQLPHLATLLLFYNDFCMESHFAATLCNDYSEI